jgi:hypothetical protein
MLVTSATTGRPEHRKHRREAPEHEDDDREQRQEVVPVALAQVPHRVDLRERDVAHAVLAGVDLDHQEQCQVVQQRGDARHQQHVEVRDLQELGDQERRRAEHRRRDDRAQAARGEQPAGGVLLVADLLEHRVRDRAERHRRRHAGPRRPAEQERREHDGAAGARRLAAHRREREVEIELSGARELQERAVDREQDDQRRRDVDGDAEDPLERHVHHADQAREVVALVRPRRGQERPGERVGDEGERDRRHDPAARAPHRLEDERHEREPERDVPAVGRRVAVGEVVAALDRIDDDRDRERGADPVPPHHAVAKALRDRKDEKAQEQHERDVHRPERLRRHDRVRGVEVECRHRERRQANEAAEPAVQLVGCAFFLLDELLGALERLGGDGVAWCCRLGGHGRRRAAQGGALN